MPPSPAATAKGAPAVAAGTAPPTVLTLLFPATALFTRVTRDVRLTILDLINGLLGNLGVLGGATVLYAVLVQLYDACAQRLTKQAKAEGIAPASTRNEPTTTVAPRLTTASGTSAIDVYMSSNPLHAPAAGGGASAASSTALRRAAASARALTGPGAVPPHGHVEYAAGR